MPRRAIRLVPIEAAPAAFDQIRAEAGVPDAFPAAVEAEAEAAAVQQQQAGERPRIDIPFVTIDPPGSRDLDQALHIERTQGGGHRVSYAIADVGAFVTSGGALDADTRTRGVTVYAPDRKAPLHPPVLSEDAASLLPGEWRGAAVWTLDLDASGALARTQLQRALVKSTAQHTYADVPPDLEPLLREVGERRLELERKRGGVRLAVPEQEVEKEGERWTVRYRVPLPSEEWNAQISLLTGIAAAELMLRNGVGILRTQPPPSEKALRKLRVQAAALHVDWPQDMSYPDFVRTLDPAKPVHAALMHEAAGVGRGAGYTAFDGGPPPEPAHFAIAAPYAHATAPLRRLQDRFVTECCLAASAGTAVPGYVREALPTLPDAMAAADRRAHGVERAIVDLVEALLLQGREGESFDAVAIDEGLVQLRDPAVRGRLENRGPEPGTALKVRLARADPATRSVAFSVAS